MNKKLIYAKILDVISVIAGVDGAKIFDTRLRFHKKINLKNPQTLSEKVSYIELHEQSPLASQCSDKYAVRDYVRSKGFEDILVPLIGGVLSRVEDIDFSILPDCFAIKATHGCKMNYIVPDKTNFDEEKCKKEIQRWLGTTYGKYSMEPHYFAIPHRFYIEEYLHNTDGLIDYKFHCMNGVPQFVLVCSNRIADGDDKMCVTLDVFNREWQPIFELIPSYLEIPGNGKMKKPRNFDKMIEIARVLSADFKFVRVDLYEIDDKIFFGELTFTPGCGVFPYFTDEFDAKMGKLLMIEKESVQ